MKKLILALGIISSLIFLPAVNVGATSAVFSSSSDACSQSGSNLCQDINGSDSNSIFNVITTVTNLLMYVLGGVSVLMMIIAGIMFATSAGKPDQAGKAGQTALYAAIGLVVAIAGYAIVNFVLSAFL